MNKQKTNGAIFSMLRNGNYKHGGKENKDALGDAGLDLGISMCTQDF